MNPFQKKIEGSILVSGNNCSGVNGTPWVNISRHNIRVNRHCMTLLGIPLDRPKLGVNYYINQKDSTLIIELCQKDADALYIYTVKVGGSITTINNNLKNINKPALKPGHYPVKELYADALNSKYYVEIPLTAEDVK